MRKVRLRHFPKDKNNTLRNRFHRVFFSFWSWIEEDYIKKSSGLLKVCFSELSGPMRSELVHPLSCLQGYR